jgi:hypothetical protein
MRNPGQAKASCLYFCKSSAIKILICLGVAYNADSGDIDYELGVQKTE